MKTPRAAQLQSSKNALLILLFTLIGMGLLALIAKFGFRQSNSNSLFIAMAVGLGASYIWFVASRFRTRGQAGLVLLDLWPYPNATLARILGGLFITLGLLGVYRFKSFSVTDSWLFSAVAGLAFGTYWILMGFGRLQIREGGIWIYADLLKWERIESFDWIDQSGAASTLKFQLKGRVPAFLRQAALAVPTEKKQQLEMILDRYLPGRASNEKGA